MFFIGFPWFPLSELPSEKSQQPPCLLEVRLMAETSASTFQHVPIQESGPVSCLWWADTRASMHGTVDLHAHDQRTGFQN